MGVWSITALCCSSSCRQLCSSKNRVKRRSLPLGSGPSVTAPAPSARLCLPAGQARPEERGRVVPAGRASGGRWMQRVREAHSRDMTAHPGGCTCAGKEGLGSLSGSPSHSGAELRTHFLKPLLCFFPKFPPQYFHSDSEGKITVKQWLACKLLRALYGEGTFCPTTANNRVPSEPRHSQTPD